LILRVWLLAIADVKGQEAENKPGDYGNLLNNYSKNEYKHKAGFFASPAHL
jgi:hypothetical protein